MAETRDGMDAVTWLTMKADDAALPELEKQTLDNLEQRYGAEYMPDAIEQKLRESSGTTFATASDEQIITATNELVLEDPTEHADGTESADQEEEEAAESGGDFSLPSEQEMAELIASSIVDDSEFRAALDGQWQQVEIPDEHFDAVVAEVVELISQSVRDGLLEAMAEMKDSEPATSWSDAEIDETMKQLLG